MKLAGKPYEGKLHVRIDEAGAGSIGATAIRQSSTLRMSSEAGHIQLV